MFGENCSAHRNPQITKNLFFTLIFGLTINEWNSYYGLEQDFLIRSLTVRLKKKTRKLLRLTKTYMKFVVINAQQNARVRIG